MLGEIIRAIKRYAETTTADVVGDNPVFQLGHFHFSLYVAGRPISSGILGGYH
jgi:hypothetical protein